MPCPTAATIAHMTLPSEQRTTGTDTDVHTDIDLSFDSGQDWDDAFANAAHIPDADDYLKEWPIRASGYRAELLASGRLTESLPYGPAEREVMDLFHPEGAPKGVAAIVHGGYWLRFDARTFSQLAAGAVNRGWLVAMPSYPLCPSVGIADITSSLARAITLASEQAAGPVHLAGHSAGGHLVTRQLCADTALDPVVSERIKRVLSISGVHDLRPLLHTRMNDQFGLDDAAASEESPALQNPHTSASTIAWVGGEERPEFIRQTHLLEEAWAAHGAVIRAHVEPDKHHFDVIEDLVYADSRMMEAWLM